jgi:hypothetical protein
MSNQPEQSNLFNKIINDRQFNFQTLEFGNITGYSVNVKDEEGTRWEFRMFLTDEGSWKIDGEKLPSWIIGLETELQEAVEDHE